MIATVTLNPAVDKTLMVESLVLGESNPIKSYRIDPGGKGINVSRVIKELGRETKALGFIGGDTGHFLKHSLERRGVPTNFVEIDRSTRTNVTLVDLSRPPATEFNEKGPCISQPDLELLKNKIFEALPHSRLIVFAGSLPQGAPDDTYYQLIELAEKKGLRCVLDSRGEAFTVGLRATPFMIKPNRHETEQVLKVELKTMEDTVKAARQFIKKGIEVVVISMGQDGAILATQDKVWHAEPPEVKVGSGVGAGDSMVAGICVGIVEQMSWGDCLALGTAAGAATTMRPGTELCRKVDVDKLLDLVKVKKLKL